MATYSPLALAMALTIANMAEAGTSFAQQAMAQAMLPDGEFLIKARQGGKAEAELGELAQRKAESHKIKSFAEMIERDHETANTAIRLLADRLDVKLVDPSADQKATYARLEKLSGAAFDRAWLEQMMKDHQAAIELFTQGLQARDLTVRTFAEAKLAVLKDHLKRVQELFGEIK